MKITTLSGLMITCFILFSLVACGGSGGDNPQPTKAVLTLSTTGTAGTVISAATATINLPAGVTVKASPSSANPQMMVTDPGVVSASGQAAGAEAVIASYLASSTTASTSKVQIYMAKSGGFSVGEFAVVNCDIATGHSPSAADFTVTDFTAWDSHGLTISGLTIGFTAAIQ